MAGIYFYAKRAGDTSKGFSGAVRRARTGEYVREATASPEINLFVMNGRRNEL